MTAVEWGLLAIVGAGSLIGLLRGAIRGFIDLTALLIGLAGAAYATPWIDEHLVGYGVDSRIVLIAIVASVGSVVTAVGRLVLRLIAAPLGMAKAIPPFGWFDQLAGLFPGAVKGALAAVVLVAILLVQFPSTGLGRDLRATEVGDRLAQAGSTGYEQASSWTGRDLHGLTAREIGPGQTWTGPAALPSGNLRPDAEIEEAAWQRINDGREREGLQALISDAELVSVARAHAQDARGAENRRLAAPSEDVGDRLAEDGRNCLAVGAVLATGESAADLVDSLLASDKHREVLLSNTYVFAGLGVIAGADGRAILVGVFVF